MISSVILTAFISLHYSWTYISCSDGYAKEIENQNRNNNKNKIGDIIKETKGKHTWAIFEITIEIKKNDFPRLKEDFIKKGLKIFMSQSYCIKDDNLYKGTIGEEGPKAYMLINKEEAENIAISIKKNENTKKKNETNFKEGKGIPKNNENVKIPFYILVEDISTYNIDANSHNADKTKNHFETLDNYCNSKGFTYSIKIFAADTSDVTDISFIFSNCKALTKIAGLENWNIKNVTDMGCMFFGCKKLTEIKGINKWKTGNVTNMRYMFYGCEALENIDLSDWNTGNVTGMCYMFDGCKALTNIKCLKWNTKNVTVMMGMFNFCNKLTEIKGIDKWNTINVTDMNSMFCGCNSLQNIDLSNWNTGNVANMSYMFSGCENLTEIKGIEKWKIGNGTSMIHMFKDCNNLKNIPSKFNKGLL